MVDVITLQLDSDLKISTIPDFRVFFNLNIVYHNLAFIFLNMQKVLTY